MHKEIRKQALEFRDEYLDHFKDMAVYPLVETEKVRCYRICQPHGRMHLVQLTFTPEGTHICGDVSFAGSNHSCFSKRGFEWFTKASYEPEHLASNFLQQRFSRDQLVLDLDEIESSIKQDLMISVGNGDYTEAQCLELETLLKDRGTNYPEWYPNQKRLKDAVKNLKRLDRVTVASDEHEFVEDARQYWELFLDMNPGIGYDPFEVGTLCAIQTHFQKWWSQRDSA